MALEAIDEVEVEDTSALHKDMAERLRGHLILSALLAADGSAGKAALLEMTGLTEKVLLRTLNALRGQGSVERIGSKRWTQYAFVPKGQLRR